MTRQLQLFDDLFVQSPPHAKGLKQRFHRFFFGDDIFISYSRSDAGKYAMALAVAMSEHGYLCFLDQLGTDVNRNMPESLKAKVRTSTALVLIGTAGAAASRYVREEVEIFKQSGRPIHPIGVEDVLAKEEWPELAGLTWISESRKRVESGEPDSDTVTQLKNASRYRRRSQVLRLSLLAGFAFIAVTVLASVLISNKVVTAAEDRRVTAERAAGQAKGAAESAAVNEGNATVAMGVASGQEAIAKNNSGEAIAQQRLAEAGMKHAQDLERTAKERAAEATRQGQGTLARIWAQVPAKEFDALKLAVGAAEQEIGPGKSPSELVTGGLTAAVTSLDQAIELQGLRGEVKLTQISPNASRVFVATNEKAIDASGEDTERWGIWDARTGRLVSGTIELKKNSGSRGAITASFSGDGSRLVVQAQGVEQGRAVAESTDQGFWLYLCDEAKQPCSSTQPMFAQKLPEEIGLPALDREGRRLAFFRDSEKGLVVADLDWATPNVLAPEGNWRRSNLPLNWGSVLRVAFTPDDGLIAFSPGSNSGDSFIYKCSAIDSAEKCISLKSDPGTSLAGVTDKGDPILRKNPQQASGIVVQPNSLDILLPQFDRSGEGAGERTLRGFKGLVRSVAISDGSAYVVTQHGEKIYVSGASSSDSFATLRAHDDRLTTVRYSPDGLHAVTLDVGGVVNVWEAKTGNLLYTRQLPRPEGSAPPGVEDGMAAFSADGSQLVAVNRSGGFGVWRIKRDDNGDGGKDGEEITRCAAPGEVWSRPPLLGPTLSGVTLLAERDTTQRIVTRHYPGRFFVWDLKCNIVRRLETDVTNNPSASSPDGDNVFSRDGKVVSVSADKEVQLWNLLEAGTPSATGAQQLTPSKIGQLEKGPYPLGRLLSRVVLRCSSLTTTTLLSLSGGNTVECGGCLISWRPKTSFR